MSWRFTPITRLLLSAPAAIESAPGFRRIEADTLYGDITAMLPEYAADEGPLKAVNVGTTTLYVYLNGSTCNGGFAGPIALQSRQSALIIPGSSAAGEWIVFEPVAL